MNAIKKLDQKKCPHKRLSLQVQRLQMMVTWRFGETVSHRRNCEQFVPKGWELNREVCH